MRKNNPNAPGQADPWASSTYQTGFTTPPKSRNGIIVALLVVVIVLCGIITVLSITNVKLFRMISGQDDSVAVPISLSSRKSISPASEPASIQHSEDTVYLSSPLGIQGERVPKEYQLYYDLPCGLYVQQVDPLSSSAHRGLQPRDIVTQVDGYSITCPQDFYDALANYAVGETVTLTVYRNARAFPISVIMEPTR